ncbi:type II toxin-antitoxin system RelE/ParE family toxin [Hydrogenophilus islandicus]
MDGPSLRSSRPRHRRDPGHVARHGRKGRHVVFFRARDSEAVIDVLRILHDSMEPQQHLSAGLA